MSEDVKDQRQRRAARQKGVKALTLARRKNAWTRAKVMRFFDALAEKCDVTAAAAAAGIDASRAYRRRNTDPKFRDLWEAAMAEAVERAEMLVIGRALKNAAGDEQEGAARGKAGNGIDGVTRAIASRDARLKRDGRVQVACMPIDELERLLTRRLAAIEKRLAKAVAVVAGAAEGAVAEGGG